MRSRSSSHSRSNSDFIGSNSNYGKESSVDVDKIGGSKPPLSGFKRQNSNPKNARYDYNRISSANFEDENSVLSNGDNSPSASVVSDKTNGSAARQYKRKRYQSAPTDHEHSSGNKGIMKHFKSPPSTSRSPRSPRNANQMFSSSSSSLQALVNGSSNNTPNKSAPPKKKRVITSKYDQYRQNYVVRADYVDQHKSFTKYASDRNKSWKKWIKLLQSHNSDITNVRSPAQVQALIDFARMSLGNYGNWLMMKRGFNVGGDSNDGSQSSNKSSQQQQSGQQQQWTTYFAVMRDFNLFFFHEEFVPSTLNDVVSQDYLALAVAHIESVKQCTSNPTELYLEVPGSRKSRQLKLRCESVEACQQWVAEMNYQIHIVSDLCCNQALRLECADQKRSIWIPVAPMTQINPYLRHNQSYKAQNEDANNNENNEKKLNGNANNVSLSSLSAASKQHTKYKV